MYGDQNKNRLDYKDAIFLSPHKFIGGPSTPGVLVVRRELLRNRVPDVPGGGTVAYVNPTEHRYLEDPTQREEGGTPAIIESIRAGLVLQLKQAVGVDVIRAHEEHYLRRAITAWQHEPNIEILGNLGAERLSIVSFLVRAPSGRYLHHNFVVACSTTSSGSSPGAAARARAPTDITCWASTWIVHMSSNARSPTAARASNRAGSASTSTISSPSRSSPTSSAVRLVAQDGWRLLEDYRFDPASGMWRHHRGLVEPPLRLRQISYDENGVMQYPHHENRAPETDLQRYLREATTILTDTRAQSCHALAQHPLTLSEDFEHLRWFDLPTACLSPS